MFSGARPTPIQERRCLREFRRRFRRRKVKAATEVLCAAAARLSSPAPATRMLQSMSWFARASGQRARCRRRPCRTRSLRARSQMRRQMYQGRDAAVNQLVRLPVVRRPGACSRSSSSGSRKWDPTCFSPRDSHMEARSGRGSAGSLVGRNRSRLLDRGRSSVSMRGLTAMAELQSSLVERNS
jgi:hypothetical protein